MKIFKKHDEVKPLGGDEHLIITQVHTLLNGERGYVTTPGGRLYGWAEIEPYYSEADLKAKKAAEERFLKWFF